MIVVDTNIIAYLYLEGQGSAQAEAVLEKDPDWVAPILWRSEFRNVLTLYLRQGILSFDDALHIVQEAENQMQGGEYEVSFDHVLSLVEHSRCSAYDCEFVALAQDLDVLLVASDRKVLSEFHPRLLLWIGLSHSKLFGF